MFFQTITHIITRAMLIRVYITRSWNVHLRGVKTRRVRKTFAETIVFFNVTLYVDQELFCCCKNDPKGFWSVNPSYLSLGPFLYSVNWRGKKCETRGKKHSCRERMGGALRCLFNASNKHLLCSTSLVKLYNLIKCFSIILNCPSSVDTQMTAFDLLLILIFWVGV